MPDPTQRCRTTFPDGTRCINDAGHLDDCSSSCLSPKWCGTGDEWTVCYACRALENEKIRRERERDA